MANWITTKQGNHIDLDLYQSIEEYYEGMNFPTVYLNKKERVVIPKEINRLFKAKYKNKYICIYSSGNAYNQTDGSYIYVFENHGFDTYRFIDKIVIRKRNIHKMRKAGINIE